MSITESISSAPSVELKKDKKKFYFI